MSYGKVSLRPRRIMVKQLSRQHRLNKINRKPISVFRKILRECLLRPPGLSTYSTVSQRPATAGSEQCRAVL